MAGRRGLRTVGHHRQPCYRRLTIRAGGFRTFTDYWRATFREGELDHATKELCRLYITRTTNCQFCGNQRSTSAALPEYADDELLNHEAISGASDKLSRSGIKHAQPATTNSAMP